MKNNEIEKWNVRYKNIQQASGLYPDCEHCTPGSDICPRTEKRCLFSIKKENSVDKILRKINLLRTNIKYRLERKKMIKKLKSRSKVEK